MKTIHKYQFQIKDTIQTVLMPRLKFLKVDNQNGILTLWAEIDQGLDERKRQFRIVGAGQPLFVNDHYVGTAQIDEFVWHLYEVK